MTITRLHQAGAELNNILSEFTSVSNVAVTTSATKAQSGTYSFRFQNQYTASLVLSTTYTQMRVGFFALHFGTGAGDDPGLIAFAGSGTIGIELRWDGDASTFRLYRNTTQIASVLSAEFAAEDAWHHVAIDLKLDNSAGWVYVYVDGVAIIEFDGDTIGTVSALDTVRFGSDRTNISWDSYLYIDDFYLDSTTGESAPAAPPDYRFLPVLPAGNGYISQWVGNDADSTDNYLLVDETPPDGDTSYVESAGSGEIDSYTMTNPTISVGWEISAVIAMAVVKKLNAGGSLNLKLNTRTTVSAVNHSASSSPIVLGTSYALAWDRRALRPDGGVWNQATVDVLEIGVITD
jgi:hypothetical protein